MSLKWQQAAVEDVVQVLGASWLNGISEELLCFNPDSPQRSAETETVSRFRFIPSRTIQI